MTLTKTDDLPGTYDTVGQVVTYTLTATNAGNVTLHNVTVSDTPALTGFSCTPTIPVAALGTTETITCTGTHAITQADLDAGSFTDTGHATSTETDAPDATDTIDAATPETSTTTTSTTTIAPPKPGPLPFTGSGALPLVLIGLVLLGAGSGLVIRRRRQLT